MSEDNKELIYTVIMLSAIMPLVLSSILFWFVLAYQKRKHSSEVQIKDALLREQALIIRNQEAIEHERTRIASEMHDDLGAGLTTIRYLSEKALTQLKDDKGKEQIGRIADYSNALVLNMSEIIWALNSRYDTTENLIGYLRRYIVEYLEENNMAYTIAIDNVEHELPISGERRRNIFLSLKEILHNTVKYSNAKSVDIRMMIDSSITIQILELNGKGFDPQLAIDKGNGIYNIQKRMNNIGGDISFEKRDDGMFIIISCPFNQSK